MENLLDKSKNIHFIGIGGIGVSAIARMLLLEGKNVSGSDMSESKAVEELRKFGEICPFWKKSSLSKEKKKIFPRAKILSLTKKRWLMPVTNFRQFI